MLELIESNILEIIAGILIGVAAGGMLLSSGRILGISGIIGGTLRTPKSIESWRVLFLIGLLVGSLGYQFFLAPEGNTLSSSLDSISLFSVIIGGFLVGVGTTLGNGCTSGHGVCGVSRLSTRSIIATLLFMVSGMLTVFVFGV